MPDAFVGIGSNADPKRALRAAVAALERLGPVRCSSVYRSAPFRGVGADYLNMVAALTTSLSIAALRDALCTIEAAAGRRRIDPAVCELDLDLLLYGLRVDAGERLPRPGLFTLPFVLGPLAELAPELAHPVTGETARAAQQAAGPAALAGLENLGSVRALG
ncbi:MAG TPA: 2-amino-4-hydroxy-6-hydroxymethyldihydropteridine diphosphokinase [Gammaproteobacteria bacterium]|nr:2-amino-4-hydroxy-6-hydroxymethyldihydropteridine diphosphokinase [Gammaproteobacteria bacterium]